MRKSVLWNPYIYPRDNAWRHGKVENVVIDLQHVCYTDSYTGEIDADQSLFYYEVDMDHESHTNRDFVPVFEPVIDPDINQTLVEEVCGTNQFCFFDFQITGSQTFAQATVDSVNEYEDAVESREVGREIKL